MASTITAATLTITHTESITLNGIERGTTNTNSFASINEVDHRILSVLHSGSAIDVVNFGSAVSAGTYIAADIRYMRFTNKDDANFIKLGMVDTGADTAYLKIGPKESLILHHDDIEAFTNGSAFSSFSTMDKITAHADTATCDLEVFVACV